VREQRLRGERVQPAEAALGPIRTEPDERGQFVKRLRGVGGDGIGVSRLGLAVGIPRQRGGRIPERACRDEWRLGHRRAPDQARGFERRRLGPTARAQEASRLAESKTPEREHDGRTLVGRRPAPVDVVGESWPVAVGSQRFEPGVPAGCEASGQRVIGEEAVEGGVTVPERNQADSATPDQER